MHTRPDVYKTCVVSPREFWLDWNLPKYEPWINQTCLICHQSIPKGYDYVQVSKQPKIWISWQLLTILKDFQIAKAFLPNLFLTYLDTEGLLFNKWQGDWFIICGCLVKEIYILSRILIQMFSCGWANNCSLQSVKLCLWLACVLLVNVIVKFHH